MNSLGAKMSSSRLPLFTACWRIVQYSFISKAQAAENTAPTAHALLAISVFEAVGPVIMPPLSFIFPSHVTSLSYVWKWSALYLQTPSESVELPSPHQPDDDAFPSVPMNCVHNHGVIDMAIVQNVNAVDSMLPSIFL